VANKWRDLYEKIPADRRARIEEQVKKDLVEMRLAEVRRARELTQETVAEKLNVNQAWVSKLERQADMYVSTLRSYIKAMGGELEIIARFNDGIVRLMNFEVLDEGGATTASGDDLEDVEISPEQMIVNVWGPSFDTGLIREADSNTSGRSQTPGARTPQQVAA
jgi:transcriptional regulator with XRE-family HTH domain